jgi:raffinose/stachyose/melibiose transport system permease protein
MNTSVKKIISIICLVLGCVLAVLALYMDFSKSGNGNRGTLLIAGALLVLFGVYFLPTRKHQAIINFLFLFPLVFSFAVTVLLPFVSGVFYSMTDWNGVTYKEFVGLKNYISMFKETGFLYSFVITFLFTAVNMLLVNVIGFALALLCTAEIKGRNFFRASFFLPNLIGGIVLGYVWQFIFNKVLIMITNSNSMLSNANQALAAILIVSTWQYAGYIMMIYVTGLQTVPKEVLEASMIDGANFWITLTKIKIPMIWNTFTICIFLTLVNSFKQFDLNFALTNGAPSRIIGDKMYAGTEFLALNIYSTAISKNNYSLGQAKAVVFFIILAIVSVTQVMISKTKEVEA